MWRTSKDCPTCEVWWAWCKQSRIRSLTLYGLMLWLYSALCPCFSKHAWQALASTPGAACDLLGEAAAPQAGSRQHKATHKLLHKAPCSKHKHMIMAKRVLRSSESPFSCCRRHRWFRAMCLFRCEWFIKNNSSCLSFMPHYTILYTVALYRLFIPCLCQPPYAV